MSLCLHPTIVELEDMSSGGTIRLVGWASCLCLHCLTFQSAVCQSGAYNLHNKPCNFFTGPDLPDRQSHHTDQGSGLHAECSIRRCVLCPVPDHIALLRHWQEPLYLHETGLQAWQCSPHARPRVLLLLQYRCSQLCTPRGKVVIINS